METQVTIKLDTKTLKMLSLRRLARQDIGREDCAANRIKLRRIEEQLFERIGLVVIRVTEAIPGAK